MDGTWILIKQTSLFSPHQTSTQKYIHTYDYARHFVSACTRMRGRPKELRIKGGLLEWLRLYMQTTGVDPITRRHVRNIIEDAKKRCAIVLTTDSIVEADFLTDRIGIMAKSRLCCIGTSIRLKARSGTGFIANVSFSGSTNG